MNSSKRLTKFLKSKAFLLVVLVAIEFLVFTILSEGLYVSLLNIRNILNSIVTMAFLTVGAVLLMVRGFVDISSSQVGCMTNMLVAVFLTKMGMPWPIAILLCLVAAAIVGMLNAVLITECGFQPFIVTMAMASVIKGVTYLTCGVDGIPIKDPTMLALGTKRIAGVIPFSIILALVCIAIYGFILSRTEFGKNIYMIGGNPQASELAGLKPKKMAYILFINNSALAGIAGCLLAFRMKTGTVDAITNGQFTGMTGAILGGVSFGGGSGGMLGAFIGMILLNGFTNGLTILAVPAWWQTFGNGALLLAALTFDYLANRHRVKI